MQKTAKKQNKRQKRTHMTGEELKRIRVEIDWQPRDMYRSMGLPRRTYQDYEANKRGIPADVAQRVRELEKRDQEFMAGLPDRIHAAIDKTHPGGIPSE